MSERIRVLLVDDHQVVRKGLRTFFSVKEDIEVVAEARNGAEAVERAAACRPDVVLMDLKMPVMDGPTAIEQIHAMLPEVGIVALTSFGDESMASRAIEAGAIGYLLKNADEEELIAAVRLAAKGRGVFSPGVLEAVMQRADEGSVAEAKLTERERGVLRLVARGLTNRDIAERLSVSPSTVGFHVHNILTKLDAKTRTEAVTTALREGLIDG